MKAVIGNSLLATLKPATKEYDIWDTKLQGFILRVLPTGSMVYRCEYGRGKRVTIGKTSVLTPVQARDKAKEILADVVRGIDPSGSEKNKQQMCFQKFIDTEYGPWVKVHSKHGKAMLDRLKLHFFPEFKNNFLSEITSFAVEKWRTKRLELGIKATTINRDIAILKSCLSKAVEWNFIATHPLGKLKSLKTDSLPKIRYLSKDEENQLRKALDYREEKLCLTRLNANQWRRDRGYEELPERNSKAFADYMKPMVLLSTNTGLRRGELFNLKWEDVDFDKASLSVGGNITKSGKTRHIPLNNEALQILKSWKQTVEGKAKLVFPSKDGKQYIAVKKSWATILKLADIKNFRWHDLRHHFASKLAMLNVDLNTIRELLGHSDIKMTLRYAHLAAEHKAEAVARLDGKY